MSEQNVIAVILDCDDTICEDTTTFILKRYGVKPEEFWPNIAEEVSEGWDPTLAYVRKIIEMVQSGVMNGLTNRKLRELGSELTFYPGVPVVFEELRALVNDSFRGKVSLEFYVITGGFEELVMGSTIAKYMNDIFGCTFHEDPKKGINFPKSIVTFTEKTKYIFAINKGIDGKTLRRHPYAINTSVPEDERRVPFENMIYIGDKPSDVLCSSLITESGGHAIGLLPRPIEPYLKRFELVKTKRITTRPFMPDYRKLSDLRIFLQTLIRHAGLGIVSRKYAAQDRFE